MAFLLDFDMSTEGYSGAWEAHGDIVRQANLCDADVLSTRVVPTQGAGGWPRVWVKFASRDAAKAYTLVYLGYNNPAPTLPDAEIEQEVAEYVAHGKFVCNPH